MALHMICGDEWLVPFLRDFFGKLDALPQRGLEPGPRRYSYSVNI